MANKNYLLADLHFDTLIIDFANEKHRKLPFISVKFLTFTGTLSIDHQKYSYRYVGFPLITILNINA